MNPLVPIIIALAVFQMIPERLYVAVETWLNRPSPYMISESTEK